VPTAAQISDLILEVCQQASSSGTTIEASIQALRQSATASTSGRPLIQSTSYGGQSASYFPPGQGGVMTAGERSETLHFLSRLAPCVRKELDASLGRPATDAEVCAAMDAGTIPIVEIRYDYSGCACR